MLRILSAAMCSESLGDDFHKSLRQSAFAHQLEEAVSLDDAEAHGGTRSGSQSPRFFGEKRNLPEGFPRLMKLENWTLERV
jgi:hypothetical protein